MGPEFEDDGEAEGGFVCEDCGETTPEDEADEQDGPGGQTWFTCAHCGGWSFVS